MLPQKILVVDDEREVARLLTRFFKDAGYQVSKAYTGEEACEKVASQLPDLVLLDYRLPDIDGSEVLTFIKSSQPHVPVIIISGHGTIPRAVELIKSGAYDFVTKPFDLDQLLLKVKNALTTSSLSQRVEELQTSLRRKYSFENIVGTSAKMQSVFAVLEKIVDSEVTVLIQGESGTGKEVFARAIHYDGPRAKSSLVTVNCAAIPETLLESELFGYEEGAFTGAVSSRKGKFEQAAGGTIFLDEIGEMHLSTQAKILRVLQERSVQRLGGEKTIKVDFRLICSTNRDLWQDVQDRRFREDLYYRISVFPVMLPPLKERLEDIPLLAQHFLTLHAPRLREEVKKISPLVLEKMVTYSWPGNIRELENVVKRAIVMASGEEIMVSDLPSKMAKGFKPSLPEAISQEDVAEGVLSPEEKTLQQMEKETIQRTLKQAKGNVAAAARQLGISRATLYRKLKNLEI